MNDHLLSHLLGRFRGTFVAIGIFSVFLNLLVLTIPFYILSVFTRVLNAKSEEALFFLTIAAAAALIIQALLDLIRSRLSIRTGLVLDAMLSPRVLETVLHNAAGSVQRNVEWMRDATELRNLLNSSAIFAIFDAPFAPFYVVVIYLLHPALGAVALVGTLLLLVVTIGNTLATHSSLEAVSTLNLQAHRRVDDLVRNADAVTAMGMTPAVLEDWRTRNAETMYAMSRTGDKKTLATTIAKLLRAALQIGMFCAGAYLYIQNEILPGAIVATSVLMGRALAPIEAAIGTWPSLASAKGAYKRLREIRDPRHTRPTGDPTSLPKPAGKLIVDGITLRAAYSDKMILTDVSFELEPGTFLGIVGPSGAGKTTLGKVIVGILAPDAGAVWLDDTDLSDHNPDELGTQIGYLPQDVHLLTGTVRDNIARLRRDATAQSVLAAAVTVGVHETILQLPNGYDSDIGDAGALLSAGQRQHIALARAFYGMPKLLILDDPNSHLDAVSEQALVRALDLVKKRGTTIVVITHRPSILGAADKLLVLNKGSVDLFGERDEVIARLTKDRNKTTANA